MGTSPSKHDLDDFTVTHSSSDLTANSKDRSTSLPISRPQTYNSVPYKPPVVFIPSIHKTNSIHVQRNPSKIVHRSSRSVDVPRVGVLINNPSIYHNRTFMPHHNTQNNSIQHHPIQIATHLQVIPPAITTSSIAIERHRLSRFAAPVLSSTPTATNATQFIITPKKPAQGPQAQQSQQRCIYSNQPSPLILPLPITDLYYDNNPVLSTKSQQQQHQQQQQPLQSIDNTCVALPTTKPQQPVNLQQLAPTTPTTVTSNHSSLTSSTHSTHIILRLPAPQLINSTSSPSKAIVNTTGTQAQDQSQALLESTTQQAVQQQQSLPSSVNTSMQSYHIPDKQAIQSQSPSRRNSGQQSILLVSNQNNHLRRDTLFVGSSCDQKDIAFEEWWRNNRLFHPSVIPVTQPQVLDRPNDKTICSALPLFISQQQTKSPHLRRLSPQPKLLSPSMQKEHNSTEQPTKLHSAQTFYPVMTQQSIGTPIQHTNSSPISSNQCSPSHQPPKSLSPAASYQANHYKSSSCCWESPVDIVLKVYESSQVKMPQSSTTCITKKPQQLPSFSQHFSNPLWNLDNTPHLDDNSITSKSPQFAQSTTGRSGIFSFPNNRNKHQNSNNNRQVALNLNNTNQIELQNSPSDPSTTTTSNLLENLAKLSTHFNTRVHQIQQQQQQQVAGDSPADPLRILNPSDTIQVTLNYNNWEPNQNQRLLCSQSSLMSSSSSLLADQLLKSDGKHNQREDQPHIQQSQQLAPGLMTRKIQNMILGEINANTTQDTYVSENTLTANQIASLLEGPQKNRNHCSDTRECYPKTTQKEQKQPHRYFSFSPLQLQPRNVLQKSIERLNSKGNSQQKNDVLLDSTTKKQLQPISTKNNRIASYNFFDEQKHSKSTAQSPFAAAAGAVQIGYGSTQDSKNGKFQIVLKEGKENLRVQDAFQQEETYTGISTPQQQQPNITEQHYKKKRNRTNGSFSSHSQSTASSGNTSFTSSAGLYTSVLSKYSKLLKQKPTISTEQTRTTKRKTNAPISHY